jgi:ribosomal protein S18 acetylase RimI-like enzyme
MDAIKNGDFVAQLGTLGFVTRLKRVSDAMLHDGRRVYKKLGLDIEPNWFVIFRLLKDRGELTVTEIAAEIGFAHPSVISIVKKMAAAGYVKESRSSDDNRKRMLSLTPKAMRKLPEFERIWEAGTAAYKRMLSDVDMIKFIDTLEANYREKSFAERALDEIREAVNIEIVSFRESLAKGFAELNYEWIAKDYGIEEHDREILDAPFEMIIKPGGQIFFALIKEEAAGTVALENLDPDGFELVKMAVSPKFRGLGIGDKLIEACIRHAVENRKSRITLDSNTKQIAAINLYRKYGFREVPLDPSSPYRRVNIRMELALPPASM